MEFVFPKPANDSYEKIETFLPIDSAMLSAINFYTRYNGFNFDSSDQYYDLIFKSLIGVVDLFEEGILTGLDSKLDWEVYRSDSELNVGVGFYPDFMEVSIVKEYLDGGYELPDLLGFFMNHHIQNFVDFLHGEKTHFQFWEFGYVKSLANQKGDNELVCDLDKILQWRESRERFTFAGVIDSSKEYRIEKV